MSTYERLAIPPNVRLLSVERLSHQRWALWIHTNEDGLKHPHWERNGTYLMLFPEGTIERITVSGGEMVDIVQVMPPIIGERSENEEGSR